VNERDEPSVEVPLDVLARVLALVDPSTLTEMRLVDAR
jgi:hypothetical protein